ncbi:hypothetical protein SZ64_04335 [Erythrobacter sp. SG61-1L]|uniref:DUF7940 domain-containing protein n=1 Tax=Erythrobacter sp. SG61-1L TaxID=1603897 RepID=UPI0006C9240C|nr:hypothetical protein [Erythrobacter sp. SG61-1L]KPL67400.1 hypothetical protein SZ64_04335 [Erythrobacter sp. SG61-1L]
MSKWLIDEAHSWWRFWSIRIAAIAAIVAGVLTAHPTLLLGLIGFLPNGIWRTALAAGVSLVVFVIPTLARLWKQGGANDG